jgi:hypothetical protein
MRRRGGRSLVHARRWVSRQTCSRPTTSGRAAQGIAAGGEVDGAARVAAHRAGGARRGRRLTAWGAAGTLVLLGWGVVESSPAQAATIFVQESFTGATTSSHNWVVPAAPTGWTNYACLTASGTTSGTPIPGCPGGAIDAVGQGALRFSNVVENEEGGIAYGLSVPTSQGIDATFDTYQYGSNNLPADGIAFFLAAVDPADPAPVTAIGQPGGYLGYAGNVTSGTSYPGMVDGYLGLGLDVYGNYTNTQFDGSGCATPSWLPAGDVGNKVPSQVTVRGPGDGTAGYCLLDSTLATDGGADVALQGSGTETDEAARNASQVPVEVVINPSTTSITTSSGLTVGGGDYAIAFTPIGGTLQTLSGELPTTSTGGDENGEIPSGLYPASWINSATGLPYQLDFGFVGSTGGKLDIHEINDVTAQSITTTAFPILDAALTNTPGSVQQDGILTYHPAVTVDPAGNAESDEITLTDTFPSGETPESTGMGGTDWSCSIAGQTDTCTYALAGYPAGTVLDGLSLPVQVTAAGGTNLTDTFLVGSDDAESNQASTTVTVESPPGATATTTTLTTSANPVTTGTGTTLTAAVTAATGSPTGTVLFEDAGTTINGCGAVSLAKVDGVETATCGTSFVASQSPASLAAVYSGSAGFAPSTGTLTQDVDEATPGVTLTSSVNPSETAEDTLLTATVTGSEGVATPTGTAEFEAKASGGSYAAIDGCDAVPLDADGVATCTTSFLASGSVYDLEVVYSGDQNYTALTSGAVAQTVDKAPQTISFTSSFPSPADYGGTYTVSATGGGSTSPVVFTSGTTGVCTVSGGDLVTFVGVGTCTIDANQAADGNYSAATQASQSDTIGKEPTSFSASANPASTAYLNEVTLSASGLTAGATGTITFATGSTTWCTATVSAGAGSCTTTGAPAVGGHTVTATYGGDTDHATSTATTSFSITTDPVLIISTSGTPSGATQGTSYSLTLSASTNSSGGPAYHDPILTATLPTGETFAAAPSAAGWSCELNGADTVLTCTSTAAPIVAGTALTAVTATVDISSSASGYLQSTVSLADAADQATTVNASATVDATAPPALHLTASGTPAGAAAGTTYSLTLVPSLVGAPAGTAYHDPSITATLPAGETFAAAPSATGWSCALSDGDAVLTCASTLAPIVAGTALADVTATVDISSSASGVLQTAASLADGTDLATAANTTATVDVTAPPALSLSSSGTPTGAAAGSDYSLSLSAALGSAGGPAYADPTLTATLPAGETFAAAPTVAGWSCALGDGGTVLTCTATSAPITAATTLPTVTAQVDISSSASGSLQATATLADSADQATTATTSATVGVTPPPALQVSTSGTPSEAAAGSGYALTLSPSLGSSPAGPAYNDPTLFATLPTGESFAAAPSVTGWSCALSVEGTVLTCTSTEAPIVAGTTLPAVLATVDIASGASGSLETTVALADGADAATTGSTTATVDVTPGPVLILSTAGTPPGAAAGSDYSLTLSAALGSSPDGPAYDDPTLTATLPSGETLAAAPTPPGWSCSVSSDLTVLSCTSLAAPIPAGTSLTAVTATVDIAASASGELQTTVLLSDGGDAAAPVSTSATVDVTGPPVLQVTTSGTPAGASAGTGYGLTLSPSLGGSPTGPAYHDPVLIATLPSGETFAAAPSEAGWSCALSGGGGVLTCTSTEAPIPTGTALPDLGATVDISALASGPLQTSASLQDGADQATTATATASVEVTAPPVLELGISGTPPTAAAGSRYGVTINPSVAESGGPVYGTTTLTVTLPTGETFAAEPSPTGWSCGLSGGGRVLTCTSPAATHAAGSAMPSVSGTVEVAPSATGSLETTATLSDSADLATAAAADATVGVTPPPVLEIATTGTPSSASAGGSYDLILGSALGASGGAANGDPTLFATLPTGETFAAAPDANGWSCSLSASATVVTCGSTLAPIAAGTVFPQVSAIVQIAPTASGALETTAALADADDAATTVSTTATVGVTPTPVLVIATSGTPATAAAGSVYNLNVGVSLSSWGGPAGG